MTRPFIAYHKFDLDLPRIIEKFHIWNILNWLKLSSLGLEDLSYVYKHLLKTYPKYMSQISLTSLRV